MKTESGKDKMFILVGKGVSPGLAKGKAFIYRDVLQRDSELYVIDRAQIGEEKARIEKAITDVRQGLNIDAKRIEGKLGKHSANIFLAQEAILLDSFVVEEMKRILEAELINAEQVVRTVFRLLARRFRDMNIEVLRERGDDIDDLSRRLLLSLAGIHAHSLENLPANTVLVGCCLRTRCFYRVRPPSLYLQSSLAPQRMRLFSLANSAFHVWVGFLRYLKLSTRETLCF
jgi:phosphoenolpyruvate-protein kinase (PTS system EI component)